MKTRKFKRLRKKLQDIDWLEEQLLIYRDKAEENNRFHRWKCDEFFVGEDASWINYRVYKKEKKLIDKRIDLLWRRIKILKAKEKARRGQE